MNQRHAPSATTGRRQLQGQAKPARPGAHRRVHSYHNVLSQSQSSAKVASVAARKVAREEVQVESDEDGMAGLPQFCMTCERQIVNPGHNTLYCSRACQRRDSAKPAQIDPLISPAFVSAPSYFDVPQPDIVPQRSPTVLRPPSLTFSDLHISSLDEDPDPSARSKRFSDVSHTSNTSGLDDSFSLSHRPQANRTSTSTLPSLSHTPSSSVGTTASTSFTYSNSRPLPTRHEPCHHRPMRSADLVIPTFTTSPVDGVGSNSVKSSASTLTSFNVAEAEASQQQHQQQQRHSWTKQPQRSPGTATGSLRQLFEHEAMTSTPRGRRGFERD